MEEEELNKIIAKIENENPKDKAFFGINNIGDDGDEAYISANKYGLKLFACQLLKASRKANEINEDSEKNIIQFDKNEKWITGNIWIGYIELKTKDRIDAKVKPYKRSWKDKVAEYGCLVTIVIIIVIFIVGISSVIDWFK